MQDIAVCVLPQTCNSFAVQTWGNQLNSSSLAIKLGSGHSLPLFDIYGLKNLCGFFISKKILVLQRSEAILLDKRENSVPAWGPVAKIWELTLQLLWDCTNTTPELSSMWCLSQWVEEAGECSFCHGLLQFPAAAGSLKCLSIFLRD